MGWQRRHDEFGLLSGNYDTYLCPENLSLPLVSKPAKLVDPLRNSALFPFERLYKHNIYSSRGVVALMKRYHG